MVREATRADIATIVDFGQALVTETNLVNPETFSRTKTGDLMASLIGHPDGILLVHEGPVDIDGAMAGAVTAHPFSYEKYAFEFGLFVPSVRRGGFIAASLIRAFERRAKELGATEFRPGIMTGKNVQRITKLYEKLGFVQTGTQLVKRW